MPLLEINGLRKSFGGLQALGGVDFHVNEGEVVSVIGPNGAGKTSFFNVISGMFEPDEGEIVFEGLVPRRASAVDRSLDERHDHVTAATALLDVRW